MPQGNPDPYSAFSQGLTGGMNTGMNIMQMMQQKAQAKMDESMKKISTSFTVGGQDYLPLQVRVDNINQGLDEFSQNALIPLAELSVSTTRGQLSL